jgi:hypothetical protein
MNGVIDMNAPIFAQLAAGHHLMGAGGGLGLGPAFPTFQCFSGHVPYDTSLQLDYGSEATSSRASESGERPTARDLYLNGSYGSYLAQEDSDSD